MKISIFQVRTQETKLAVGQGLLKGLMGTAEVLVSQISLGMFT